MKSLFFTVLVFLALIAGMRAQSTDDFTPSASQDESKNKIRITGKALRTDDILVVENQQVTLGEPLISRALEINAIATEESKTLERLSFVKSQQILEPIKPIAREFVDLPPSNFKPEELSISALESRCAREEFSLEIAKSQDLIFSSDAGLAKLEQKKQHKSRELFQAQDLMNNLQTLKFENHYIRHQSENIKKLVEEVEQIDKDILIEQGKINERISGFESDKKSSIQSAEDTLQNCRERLQIAVAQFEKAKYERALLEQNHLRSRAIYLQEQDKSEQIYQRDKSEYQRRIEAQRLNVFDLELQLTDIEFRRSQIAEIRSPYTGVIRRVKIDSASDGFINVEFTLNY